MRPAVVVAAAGFAAVAACGGGAQPGGVITVTVAYPGARAAEVEQALLAPIENAVAGVRGVYALRGRARDGAATIDVTLVRGTAVVAAMAAVRQALVAVDPTLPTDADRPLVVEQPAAWIYGRISDDPRAASALVATLERLPVLRVETCGVREARLAVEVVSSRLAEFDVTVAEVATAIATTNVGIAGRSRDDDDAAAVVAGVATYDDVADTTVGPGRVRVRDLAVISERAEAHCLVTGPPGVGLIRVGVQRRDQRAATELAMKRAGITALPGSIAVVTRGGRPTHVELASGPADAVVEATLAGDDAVALAAAGRAAVAAVAPALGVTVSCLGCDLAIGERVAVDRDRAAQLGVPVAEIAQALRTAMAGTLVAERVDRDRRLGIVVAVEEGGARWRDLLLRAPSGAAVRLGDVVIVERASGPAELLHVGRRPVIVVRVRGRAGTSLADLRRIAAQALPGATVRVLDAAALEADRW